MAQQIEISSPLEVLDNQGRPVNFGWARSPLFNYNADFQRALPQRITSSDRYIIFSLNTLIIMEVLDGGYLGYVGISIISLTDKKRSTQSFVVPLSLGRMDLPRGSDSGSVRLRRRNFFVEFTVMEGGARIIKVDIPRFGHHRYLRGELVLSSPADSESLVTHKSWPGEKYAFVLTRRSPWFAAEGVMQFGGQELIFGQGSSWAILDWNRGSRPRKDLRFWAAACGKVEETAESPGGLAGFSVGYGSADGRAGTENGFFLNGRLHKLEEVTFHISPNDWLKPWRFSSSDNRLEMTFSPHQERTERHRFFFHYLNRRQVIGYFSGTVILDDGKQLSFTNLTGIAERKRTGF